MRISNCLLNGAPFAKSLSPLTRFILDRGSVKFYSPLETVGGQRRTSIKVVEILTFARFFFSIEQIEKCESENADSAEDFN